MFRRISLFLVLLTLVLFAGCGEEEEMVRETLEPSPLPVSAAVAEIDVLYEVISSTGRCQAEEHRSSPPRSRPGRNGPEYAGEAFSRGM